MAPWQFCHACFSPRFMPALPPTFNDVSCLLHAVIIAPPPLALSRLLSSKVIIADNRCLAFFRHPLIRKFLSPFRSTRRERAENESRTRREDGQRLLCGCYARVHSEAELEINNPCYKVFGHAEDIDYVACSTHTKPVPRL